MDAFYPHISGYITYRITPLRDVSRGKRARHGITDEMLSMNLSAFGDLDDIYGCFKATTDENPRKWTIYFRSPLGDIHTITELVNDAHELITECVHYRVNFYDFLSNVVSTKRFRMVYNTCRDIAADLYSGPLWRNSKDKYMPVSIGGGGAQHCVDVARKIVEDSPGPCLIVVDMYEGGPYYIFRRDPAVAGYDFMIAGDRNCFEPFAGEFPMIA